MHNILEQQYPQRINILKKLGGKLTAEIKDVLIDREYIDRISFRPKSLKSFVGKALDPQNDPPYTNPLVEIEDQIAGRVIVFFRHNIEPVKKEVLKLFNSVERIHRKPKFDAEFGYETHHLICIIPPHLIPRGWKKLNDMPTTFELQIRTIFMHAYAEPQHDFIYKRDREPPAEIKKELAWIAASSWGADHGFERVWNWHIQTLISDDNSNQGKN